MKGEGRPAIDPELWSRVEELFHQAEALPASDRSDFLERACRGDAGLRREVDSLLAADEGVGSSLEDAVVRAAREAADATGEASDGEAPGPTAEVEAMAGRRIGAYEVLRELGRGGMGTVYLARRADRAFEQTVAIKVLREGLGGGSARRDRLARFRAERQILADLDHPSIARLHDGGTTEEGAPYLVMEHVDGQPIDRWCEERRLGVDERLELFVAVCDAVRSAHQSLVVHRDIKPSNILVTADGRPKLLDFGIAKLLDPVEVAAADLARTGTLDRLLTPEFASPEQVRGEPVTTRTDVYALGLLLHLLLTGQRPYTIEGARPAEIERVICEQPPTRPSTAVSQVGGDGAPVLPGGERGEQLSRRLRGDLDTIVLHALAKEPERRYASVGELIEDVRRHREGLPVRARPATAAYRVRKFVGRHRAGVAAGVVGAVLLAGLGGFHLDRITRERDLARREAAKASQVASFLTALFEASDPAEARGESLTARQLLDRGAERIDRELASEPEVQATLMNVVGEVSLELGDYEQARELLERSLELRRRLLGPRHPDVAEGLHDLATLLALTGEHGRAEELFRQALDLRLALHGEKHPSVASTLAGLGDLVQVTGRLEEAEGLYRRGLAIVARLPVDSGVDETSLLNNLGRVLHERGALESAESHLRRALEIRRERHGDLHPATRSSVGNLAILLQARGSYAEAETLHREALAVSRRLYGNSHPQVGVALNNLASFLKQRSRYAEAESLQREALEMFRGSFGEQHPRVAMSLNNLANLLHDQGAFDEAKALHLEALAMYRAIYGNDHANVAGSLNNLAVLLKEMGDLEAAEPLHREALALDRRMLGAEHPYVASDLDSLATLLLEKGDPQAALPLIEESLAMKRKLLGDEHADTGLTLALKGRLLLGGGQPEEAEPLLRRALAVRRAALPADHPGVADSESLLGACLVARGRYAEAEPLLLHGHRVLAERGGRHVRERDRARERLRELYEAWERPDLAAAYTGSGR